MVVDRVWIAVDSQLVAVDRVPGVDNMGPAEDKVPIVVDRDMGVDQVADFVSEPGILLLPVEVVVDACRSQFRSEDTGPWQIPFRQG